MRTVQQIAFTHFLLCLAAFLSVAQLAACGPEPLVVYGSDVHAFTMSTGQELDITLSTVGPGQYDSLPVISSLALRFVDMSFVGPNTPAGPNQRFRFNAVSSGRATIFFNHSNTTRSVLDTVDVR